MIFFIILRIYAFTFYVKYVNYLYMKSKIYSLEIRGGVFVKSCKLNNDK